MTGYGIAAANEGDGLLPWSWAVDRLSRARSYYLATVTAGQDAPRPHVMVVWAIWLDDALQFSTAPESRKGKNLAANPRCTISLEADKDEAVILEGIATMTTDPARIAPFAAAYQAKYEWDMSSHTQPIYIVRPTLVFGFIEATFTKSATRWVFETPAA
jgi:hypothetical protein